MSMDHRAKGNEAFAAKRFDEAIEQYGLALSVDPRSHVALSNRSFAYYMIKDYQKSYEDACEAIGIDSSYAKVTASHGPRPSARFLPFKLILTLHRSIYYVVIYLFKPGVVSKRRGAALNESKG